MGVYKRKPVLNKKELKNRVVTEALLPSITKIGNSCCKLVSSPVAIKYLTKSSNKGETMKSYFYRVNEKSSGL